MSRPGNGRRYNTAMSRRCVIAGRAGAMAAALWPMGVAAQDPPALDRAGDWPDLVQPYLALVRGAAAYESLRYQWRVVCDEPFDDRPDRTWRVPDGEPMAAVVPQQLDGRSVVVFQTDGKRAGWIAVGEPVGGDYSIELVGCTLAPADVEPCDLSVFAGRIGHGPGVQFGAWFNKRNLLWVAPTRHSQSERHGHAARPYVEIDVPASRLIERGRWHRVRMEVTDGRISGFVDDELIGASPLGRRHDRDELRQPYVYLYGTTAAIDRVVVRQRGPVVGDADDRLFDQCFAGRSRQEVSSAIGELADLLNHESWPVRDAAQRLLTLLGPHAQPSLQRLADAGTLEQQHRARRILDGPAAAE